MNRESFEKIPEIRSHLEHGNVFWNEDVAEYSTDFSSLIFLSSYVNGAWMMYQEQQKKLEDVLQQLDTLQEKYWSRWKEKADMMDQGASVAYEHSYWTLKDVLK